MSGKIVGTASRRIRCFLLLAVLGLGVRSAGAQNAEAYFHGSAHKFVAGRLQEATLQVEEGLRKFPDHAALKGLAAHLRRLKDQQKKDQGSQGSSQGDEGKDKHEDKDKKDGEGGGKDKEQPEREEEKDQGKEDQKGPEGQDTAQAGDKDGKDSTGETMAPVKPGEMSKEDAERLLNSVQDDEKKEHKQMQRRHRNKVDVEQDW